MPKVKKTIKHLSSNYQFHLLIGRFVVLCLAAQVSIQYLAEIYFGQDTKIQVVCNAFMCVCMRHAALSAHV